MARGKKEYGTSNGTFWGDPVGKAGSGKYIRCAESHPALKVGEHEIYGGSCINPVVSDADIYIGFDHGMKHTKAYPWAPGPQVVDVYFPVTDGCAPSSSKDFKDMVKWTVEQLKAGKKVHAGCIGGHGRTGMFLAAVYAVLTGEKDAIQYVRKNYCKKAVESASQVAFLQKHFDVSHAEPSKVPLSNWGGSSFGHSAGEESYFGTGYASEYDKGKKAWGNQGGSSVVRPVESGKNVWKGAVV